MDSDKFITAITDTAEKKKRNILKRGRGRGESGGCGKSGSSRLGKDGTIDDKVEINGKGKENGSKDGNFKTYTTKEKSKSKRYRKRKRPMEYSREKLEVSKEVRKEMAKRISERDQLTLCVHFPSTLKVANVVDLSKCLGDVVADGHIKLPKATRISNYKHCYIEFKSEAIMKKKMVKISQVEVEGEKFCTEIHSEESKKLNMTQMGDLDSFKLHVGNLPEDTTRKDLRNLFSTSSRIDFPKRKAIKTSRNFAFIAYTTKEEALKVFFSSKDLKLNGKRVRVTFAKFKTSEKAKPKTETDVENDQPDYSSDAAPSPAKNMKMEGKVQEDVKAVAGEGDKTEGDNDEMEVKEKMDVDEQGGDDDDEVEEEDSDEEEGEQQDGDEEEEEEDGDDDEKEDTGDEKQSGSDDDEEQEVGDDNE